MPLFADAALQNAPEALTSRARFSRLTQERKAFLQFPGKGLLILLVLCKVAATFSLLTVLALRVLLILRKEHLPAKAGDAPLTCDKHVYCYKNMS